MSQFIGNVSAYAYAQTQGYTGTEEEFAELMTSYATVAEAAEASAQSAASSASAASGSASTANTAAQTAATKASEAAQSATGASQSATQAESAKSSAQASAQTATTKASEASQSATNASGSATTANEAADDATAAKTAAETAKTAAEQSATSAATSAQTAQDVLDSIPADYTELSDSVEDIKSAIGDIVIDPLEWKQGAINTGGVEVASTTRIVCGFTRMKKGARFTAENGYSFRVFLYSTASEVMFIKLDGDWRTSYVLDRDCFVRVVLRHDNDATIDTDSADKITMIYVSESISHYIDGILDETRTNIGAFTNNKYISYVTGSMGTLGNVCASDYIEILPNSAIELRDYMFTKNSADNAGLAFYDADKVFISGVQYPANAADLTVTAPNTASYMRMTVGYDYVNIFILAINTHCNRVTFENKLKASESLQLFDKIICIGDSLTRGYQDQYPSGQKNRDYAYPNVLQRMTGITCENYGISGTTPVFWYDGYKNFDFSSFDCALICLGRNGGVSGEQGTAYQNIINKLKTDNPNISIFILSLPPSDVDPAISNPINTGIKAIATSNNLPYIDIFNIQELQASKWRSDNVHFYTFGYMKLAEYIKMYVEQYIDTHVDEYMQLYKPKTWNDILH